MVLRVLLLADTHLGFDLPTAPRVRRRRRGHDFLANYHRSLAPALGRKVDLVIHGGDVFHRPEVPPSLVHQAFEPLKRVADLGVPVFVVPGNHERSRIPHRRFAAHPGIRIFDRPQTFLVERHGLVLALAGFPFERREARRRFPELLEATGWRSVDPHVTLLCVHHCFEGAQVGPADFTFRSAPDVIRARDVPRGLAAVLSGHVHRHQVLVADLRGRELAAPVFYPGSVERTAFAEMGESKGYVLLEVEAKGRGDGGRVVRWTFHSLPTRPMVLREVRAHGLGRAALRKRVEEVVWGAPRDAILRLRVHGEVNPDARSVLAAPRLRELAPPEMNVDVVLVDEPRRAPVKRGRVAAEDPRLTRPVTRS